MVTLPQWSLPAQDLLLPSDAVLTARVSLHVSLCKLQLFYNVFLDVVFYPAYYIIFGLKIILVLACLVADDTVLRPLKSVVQKYISPRITFFAKLIGYLLYYSSSILYISPMQAAVLMLSWDS